LANIMGLASILETMDVAGTQKSVNELMITSAKELDQAIRKISDKID